jgi:hypothetical protein
MAIYKAKNGNKYSEDTVMSAAEKAGISLDEFISNKELEKVEDEIEATEENVDAEEDAIIVAEPPKKKKKPTSTKPKDLFGETKVIDPLGLEKFKKQQAPKTIKPAFDFSKANNTITNSNDKLIKDFGGPETPVSNRSIMFAESDAKALEQEQIQKKELEKQKAYLDKTRQYRDKVALEELSFKNPNNVN